MIVHATKTVAESCGRRPYGWMGPWISETAVTPDLLQENGYTFLMDWPADDQPFWMKTRAGRIMSVPYPIEINDTLAFDIRDSTEIAKCLRGKTDAGMPTWDTSSGAIGRSPVSARQEAC